VPLQRLIALYPNQHSADSAYAQLAQVHRELGETDAELAALRQLADLAADATGAYERLMEISAERGEWTQVLDYAERYRAVDPLRPVPYRFEAVALEATKQNAAAVQSYRTLLQLDPPNPPELHYRLARLLHSSGDKSAKRHVLMALEDAPRFRDAQQLLLEITGAPETSRKPDLNRDEEASALAHLPRDPVGGRRRFRPALRPFERKRASVAVFHRYAAVGKCPRLRERCLHLCPHPLFIRRRLAARTRLVHGLSRRRSKPLYRLQQMTSMKVDPEGRVLEIEDPELFRYPFIYIVEPGDLTFSDTEAAILRRYLLHGGFLMIDDFWGEDEWDNLATELKRVFPDRQIADIPRTHPIFHSVFDIPNDLNLQIPDVGRGTISQYNGGITWEREDAKEAHFRGIFDDQGRLCVFICHNSDNGDGWEREGENEYYFREFSEKKAYPLGINVIFHAMTH
jgi:tetratricopeptide (TPR) repeat protein